MTSTLRRRFTAQPGSIAIALDGNQRSAFATVNGHAAAQVERVRSTSARSAVLDWPRRSEIRTG